MKKKEKVTAKVTAKGLHEGKETVFSVIEYNGGIDKNGEREHEKLEFIKDGVNCRDFLYSENEDLIESALEAFGFFTEIEHCIVKRYLRQMNASHVYNPKLRTIEAYWLAFNYGDGFDKVPEITVKGKIDTVGSPFSDEDTSHVVF